MALSYHDDGCLHLWECPKVLDGHNPDFLRCGYIATGPGFCPYDHGERVELAEIVAVVQCSDCGIPIMRDECRRPDHRLICGGCLINYIGKYPDDQEEGGQPSRLEDLLPPSEHPTRGQSGR